MTFDTARFWPEGEGTSDCASEDDADNFESDPEMAYFASSGFPASLQKYGSFMDEFSDGITDESKILCNALLMQAQTVPDDTLFQPERLIKFEKLLRGMNEPMVSRELTPLMIPSLTSVIVRGATHLEVLTETADELWDACVPLLGRRPKPDYSLGFNWSAFTPAQCAKLERFDLASSTNPATTTTTMADGSYTMASSTMYFPFFTCEVKPASVGLGIADCQNTQSATIALRGLVRLLRATNREMEAHRQTLFFSLSHNNNQATIYGHYPVIEKENTYYYRHTISQHFLFGNNGGADRWQSYMFVKNLYDLFALKLRDLISSAIDGLVID